MGAKRGTGAVGGRVRLREGVVKRGHGVPSAEQCIMQEGMSNLHLSKNNWFQRAD